MTTTVPVFTLADRLRKAREVLGVDQAELAEILGVSRSSVSNAETGSAVPRRITMRAWAEATGVPLEWLTTGEWAPRGSNPQPTDWVSAQVRGWPAAA
jgi:transcriptional regulator with XRE-family HTH domain